MSGTRCYDEDQVATGSSRPRKKAQHGTLNALSYHSYTVAWICALPLEMSAGRAMLDYIHNALPQDVNDSNSYILGSIGQHNVAIACLPNDQYGTNNAAIVFTNMRRTFNNIQLGLMVGVGGGAPSKADLRLGDIVVGSRVIQHDMGKAMGGGIFNRTSIPRTNHSSVSTVVSSLRSKHYSISSRVPSILREKAEALRGFERPVSADRLFTATYRHESSITDCASCDQSKLVQRTPRDFDDPVIHYGAIASGNQVIKDSLTRDNLAQELDVICFEMEAAGLMDICPCLPIRGICDYSDSHKAKEWQNYAAATAAAYAREFLEELPVCKVVSEHKQQLQIYHDEKDKECLKDLRITNPEDDKDTIIKAKGGLLIESCRWVMENESYQQWDKGNVSRLLWIKGDPGKGKTMLLCGIINELESSTAPDSVFYFFCQASEPRLRSAIAVLRGLIWFLARRRPNLIPHIRKEYDDSGKDVFKDHNAWQALSNIIVSILNDATTSDCIFVVDALDECSDGRERLIELLTRLSSTSKSKWIVSSRNWPEIESQLDGAATSRVHLELNHTSIADAVQRFIARRVEDLAKAKRYTESTREIVLRHLLTNADDTFLWVSLVCEELGKPDVFRHHTSEVLQYFPAGLEKLYQRMINQLLHSRDEEICKAILAVVTTAFEPLSLAELATSDARLLPFQSDLQTLYRIITCCGSFLTIRNNVVYMIHQSVKDYLVTSPDIFPSNIAAQHYLIFQSTMRGMQANLHRNVYSVPDDTLYIHEISKPPSSPLDSLRYGCIYWVEHLLESDLHAVESRSACLRVEAFLKTQYLYWLEAMSLLRCVSTAIRAIRNLGSGLVRILQCIHHQSLPANLFSQSEVAPIELNDLVEDALRFVLTHRTICDIVPLQLYDSALIFSPERSQVRQNFMSEISTNISLFPSSFQQWDACLFNILNIADFRSGLRVSPGGQRLAMKNGGTILILDSFTGEVVGKFGSRHIIKSIVGFDAEGKHLATVGALPRDSEIFTIWNTYTGKPVQSFEVDARLLVLCQDRKSLAVLDPYGLVYVCDPWDGSGKYTLDLRREEGKGRIVWINLGLNKSEVPCIFSIVEIMGRGTCELVVENLQTRQLIVRASLSVRRDDFDAVLDPDGKRLLIAQKKVLQLWDGEVLTDLRCIFGPEDSCTAIAWAPDGRSFAMATRDAVTLCDPTEKARIGRVSTPSSGRTRLYYVNESTLAVTDSTSLKMLRVTSTLSEASFAPQHALRPIDHLNPGPNGHIEVSRQLSDNEVIITASHNTLCRLHIPGSYQSRSGVFSPNHQYAFVDNSGSINIWDTKSLLCLHKLRGNANDSESSNIVVEFDSCGQLISANHADGRMRLWDLTTGQCLRTFGSQDWSFVLQMAASADGSIAIVPRSEKELFIWDSRGLGEGETGWILKAPCPLCLSLATNSLLAVLFSPTFSGSRLGILDVKDGTCLGIYHLPEWIPYARFCIGSNSKIDVGQGVLDLDLERLTEVASEAKEQRFEVYIRNVQPPVWNPQFLRFSSTDTAAWLMRASKKVLWVPQSIAHSVRVTPDLDTGLSMVSMIYNSHPLIINVGGI